MIKSTFTILEGIGRKTEKRLWAEGVKSWQDFLDSSNMPWISQIKKETYDQQLLEASEEIEKLNSRYFLDLLERRQHWRLFDSFKDHAVYLDIETTGGSPNQGDLTVVGISNGRETKAFIQGINLTAENLEEAFYGARMLVTFYGSVFDIPFLRHKFPHLDLNLPHFDLCFATRRLGLKGGLKSVEAQVGIERDREVSWMNGWDAVIMWQAYRMFGRKQALDLLLKYNREDTENLTRLAQMVYQGLRRASGIDSEGESNSWEPIRDIL